MQNERNGIVDAHKSEFGHKFIVLPNPTYGDWEPGLYRDGKTSGDYWKLTPEQKSEAHNKALKKWVPTQSAQDKQAKAAK
jgi:predicted secreted acid phosphatase